MKKALVLASLLALSLGACSKSSGPSRNNPAPDPPASSAQADLAGNWICTAARVVEAIGTTYEGFAPTDRLVLETDRVVSIMGDPANRASLEHFLGTPLSYYENRVDRHGVDFFIGIENSKGYVLQGFRLALLDRDTLVGFDAGEMEVSSQGGKISWLAELTFERL